MQREKIKYILLQKSQEVLEYFIPLCSFKDDTVLDTFAGSGSTGMAAKKLNYKYILTNVIKRCLMKMKIGLQVNLIQNQIKKL